jgi:hypothetical protein
MLPDTAAPLTETSDSDVVFRISTGFGGGVYAEVDTDGVGCGGTELDFTTGGRETGGRGGVLDGAGLGFAVLTTAGEVEEGGAGECVAARVTFGLAECAGLTAGFGAAPLTGGDPPTTSVGLLSTASATGLACEPPGRATISTPTTTPAASTAAAAASLDTRRGLATVTGLGNPS